MNFRRWFADDGGWRLWRASLHHPDKLTAVSGLGWLSVRAQGDAIEFVDDPMGEPRHILRQPNEGGKATVVATAPRYAYDDGFAVDPKSGRIVYAAVRSDDTDLELLPIKRG